MIQIFKDMEADSSVPVPESPLPFERSYSLLDALPYTKLDDLNTCDFLDLDLFEGMSGQDSMSLGSEASECVVPAMPVLTVTPASDLHAVNAAPLNVGDTTLSDHEMDCSSSSESEEESPAACERDSEYVPRTTHRTRVARAPEPATQTATASPPVLKPSRKPAPKRGRRQVGRPPKNSVADGDSETQRARKRNRIAARRNRAIRKLRHEDMLTHSAQLAVENDQLRSMMETEAARLADLQVAVRRKYTPAKLAAILCA